MTRQKVIGWILVVVSCAYLVYFLKVRLLEPGPYVARREWLQVTASIVCLLLGVANVRLAAKIARERAARLSKPDTRGS